MNLLRIIVYNLIKPLSFLLCYFALASSVSASTSQAQYKGQPYYKGDYKGANYTFTETPGHFEILGGPSISQLNAGNSSVGVTSTETDELVQTNSSNWNTFGGQLGAGYLYYFGNAIPDSDKVQWFPTVEPELNVYQLTSNSIDGNVIRYNNPAFGRFTFDIPVHSTRLMLDGALTVASWRQYSLYGIGGIGIGWTRLNYNDRGDSTCPDQLKISAKTNTNFVWEVGAGLNFAVNNRVGISLEYLYTDLGRVSTSSNGYIGSFSVPVSPPSFRLKAQTGLIALHIAI